MVHRDKSYPGQHPAIISQELFDHVQKLMKETPRKKADPAPSLPFAGLVHCEHCGYAMTPAFADKITKNGPRRYHYYRCSNITRQGWDSCPIKEINAERLHAGLYQNLLRISRDSDYLSTVVRNMRETKLQNGGKEGFEPLPNSDSLTPQNLKKGLEEFLTICARRTGMERSLAIRRRIGRISYSQKRVTVDFLFALPPDGQSLLNQRPALAAPRAAPPIRTSAQNRKGSNRCEQLNPLAPLGAGKNGGRGGI